jgi:hypothetical protein
MNTSAAAVRFMQLPDRPRVRPSCTVLHSVQFVLYHVWIKVLLDEGAGLVG